MTRGAKTGDPMRMSTVFMLGTIAGVMVVGLWRRELRAFAEESSRREELLPGTKERVGTA
jgi:hypothetical protein